MPMKVLNLALAALLSVSFLAAVAPPAQAMDTPSVCEVVRCDNIEIPCTEMTMQAWDPLHEPTHVSCFIPLCDRCICNWVAAGPDVEAAGQDVTATAYVGCGVGVWATFTPGPVDTDAPICVDLHADGSDNFRRALQALQFQGVCATPDCTFPDHDLGGVVGDAADLAIAVATIWCVAAKDVADTGIEAARDTCDATMAALTGGSCPA